MPLVKDKCGKCGAKVVPGYDFCLSCGTKFSEVAPTIIERGKIEISSGSNVAKLDAEAIDMKLGDNKIQPIFCKKCGKEVIPIKEQKTPGKRAANVIGFVTGAGTIYTYPKRCPYCNKVLRTKSQKIAGIICLVIWIAIAIIGASITLILRYS